MARKRNYKMNKTVNIIIVLMAILTVTSGCILNNGTRIYNNEELIVKKHDSYNLVLSKQNVENNSIYGSAASMEGMGTIWRLDAGKATDVTITYRIKISSGKAKLVLISPNNTITNLVECTPESDIEQEKSDTIQVEAGVNRMKLIGAKDTKIEFEISADKGDISNFND